MESNNLPDRESSNSSFYLPTTKAVKLFEAKHVGTAYVVSKDNFPALEGVTCYTVEVWEESMRLPHWHPNVVELGYVISGTIEIIIWRSPGESSVFTLGPGMCWFIPKASLHSLNNVGTERAKLLVGFSGDTPQDIDLPVAINGIPAPLRNAYTSPHSELSQWKGPIDNPLFGRFTNSSALGEVKTASPYGFDLAQVTPLFNNTALGSVVWGVKSNWNILEEISVLRAKLAPGVARDPIWYPDAGTLYVVAKGKGEFTIITAGQNAQPIHAELYDYIYVPMGVLHTFSNTGQDTLEVIAFFTQANPQPEVSLSVATAFFPNNVRRDSLTRYGVNESKDDPLKHMQFTGVSPYLIKASPK